MEALRVLDERWDMCLSSREDGAMDGAGVLAGAITL